MTYKARERPLVVAFGITGLRYKMFLKLENLNNQ